MMNFDERVTLLQNMHYAITQIDDENAYERWIQVVPDEPCEEDFEDIASDTYEYKQVLELFCTLIVKYCL